MEKLSDCPICRSSSATHHLVVPDHSVTQEEFTIVQCSNCSFKYTNPRPAISDIGQYYDSDQYISHTNSSAGLRNSIYQLARKRAISSKQKLIHKWNTGGQLLDYGSGTGEFLHYMSSRGFKTQGIEPDLEAREQAIRNYGQVIVPTIDNITPSEQFHVISLWHVLEHVHDLRASLKWFYAALHEQGTLFVAVPNPGSWDAKHYAAHWAAYDVPRHLYHFTNTDIQTLFGEHGFKLERSQNMWLDAFYISMLSGQYQGKGAISSFIGGCINGLRSNLHALFSSKPTSSTLYILKKQTI